MSRYEQSAFEPQVELAILEQGGAAAQEVLFGWIDELTEVKDIVVLRQLGREALGN